VVARALCLHKGAFFYQKDKKQGTLRQKRKRGNVLPPLPPSLSLFSFPPASFSLFRNAWRGTRRHYFSVSSSFGSWQRKFMIRSLCCITGHSSSYAAVLIDVHRQVSILIFITQLSRAQIIDISTKMIIITVDIKSEMHQRQSVI